jgi:hypothetical protein
MRPYRGAAPFGNQPFRDEFDDYKDEGLEALRSDVNTCVEDADGMMSQAMTFAFMDPDFNLESEFAQPMSTIKLEANVLCDAYDWVKRMDNASLDERRAHMQMSLNKMVMMVRQGIIDADAASRAIHNCAAFLGLELATSVPKNTVVVTGLRKTCTPQDLHDAFGAFGKISEAEVADGGRGFALVRFRSAKSADRVLSAFKRDEVRPRERKKERRPTISFSCAPTISFSCARVAPAAHQQAPSLALASLARRANKRLLLRSLRSRAPSLALASLARRSLLRSRVPSPA